MAVYYINPYTTTNGTGTFGSPWSPASTTRTGLTNGDEIRILGNTNPLFFSTVYTGTYNALNQIIITSGGNLGPDFPAGSYLYIVESDAFCFVATQGTNTLTVGSTLAPMPWANTVLNSTMTIRKVDTANNGVSTTTGTTYILGAPTNLSNVIVSDAWVDATTRVTDGSVKSVFRGSGTTSSIVANLDTSTTPTLMANNTFNMQNSYYVPNPYTASGASIAFKSRDSTYNIAQITVYTSGSSIITLGTSGYPALNTTATIKHLNCYTSAFSTNLYSNNCTINITNLYAYYLDYLFGSPASMLPGSSNLTVNINYFLATTSGSASWLGIGPTISPKLTINYTGTIDYVPSVTPNNGVSSGGGDISINILPGTTVYKGRRATTGASALASRFIPGSGYIAQKIPVYTANILPTLSATSNVVTTGSALIASQSTTASVYGANDLKKPIVVNIEYPNSSSTANNGHFTVPVNILQTYRDGSWSPIEILGIDTKVGYVSGFAAATAFPNVFRDTVTVRTAGPSLRSYLATRTTAYWLPTSNANETESSSYKNIKVPIVSGSNYTITGYIRSNYASSTTGDVIMSVIYNNTVLATQNMTSAMYNSWEQFTLSFTASATGEAYLVWEMYYPSGGMSYWLDDLSIVKS